MKTFKITIAILFLIISFLIIFIYEKNTFTSLHKGSSLDPMMKLKIVMVCYLEKYGSYYPQNDSSLLYLDELENFSYIDEIKKNNSIVQNNHYVAVDYYGNPFVYKCPGKINRSSFDLISVGFDGKLGTKDDIIIGVGVGEQRVKGKDKD